MLSGRSPAGLPDPERTGRVNPARIKTLAQWTVKDWLDVLRVDLLGADFFTKQAFFHMGEAGGALAFLASDEAKFITGTTLAVDGGRLARL